MKTRLQLDETAKHLQNLESATRRAVSAAVKEFNKSQVHPGLHPGGHGHTHGRFPGGAPASRTQAQPFPGSHHTPTEPCRGCPIREVSETPSLLLSSESGCEIQQNWPREPGGRGGLS